MSNEKRFLVKPPSLDLQSHLSELEANGLLIRIDHPSTKIQSYILWFGASFFVALARTNRRAFLFTNVIDSAGRRYDIPVVVGALAASPKIYAIGMGRPVEDIGADWLHAIDHPIPPVVVVAPPCQEVVITGDDLRKPVAALRVSRFRSPPRATTQPPISRPPCALRPIQTTGSRTSVLTVQP